MQWSRVNALADLDYGEECRMNLFISQVNLNSSTCCWLAQYPIRAAAGVEDA